MDTPPTWDWHSLGDTSSHQPRPEADSETTQRRRQAEQPDQPPQPEQAEQPAPGNAPNGRRYGPRTCRICFDTEDPKFPTETAGTFGIPASNRPTYCSDDPEVGRLISPCKCNGSQKYVHEGCLMAWRLANPTEARNYWQCPTCKFTYKLSRLHWATALSSKGAQIGLTLLILLIGIFILGFIADPLFDLWSDPIGTIGETVTSVVSDIEAFMPPPYEEPVSWTEHFLKGFFSLGIVGLIKSMFAMSPWHWWNIRNSGIVNANGRRQGTGRARVENISLIFVLLGAFTFLMSIWKVVKALSARVLSKISDKVVDVGDDDDTTNEE
ncbi:RING finger domain protein [Dactylonectria macrodidyma]|uniref:RING finger domain protein n=1 Tax=Dactylonectria macrodidyma TaxID=307937 RepID=A0A9P9FFW1_9HYPO|nr:RING finger domain protein [Dactylonectria macrodidyma]